jgi:hypothetical protein
VGRFDQLCLCRPWILFAQLTLVTQPAGSSALAAGQLLGTTTL